MYGFYKEPRQSGRLRVGPLGPDLASYAKHLKDQQYGPSRRRSNGFGSSPIPVGGSISRASSRPR